MKFLTSIAKLTASTSVFARGRLAIIGVFIFIVVASAMFASPVLGFLEERILSVLPTHIDWVRKNVLLYSLCFLVIYSVASAFGLPVSVLLSLGGSALSSLAFGFWPGVLLSCALVWLSVMLGSWGLFEFVVRFGASAYNNIAGPYMSRFRDGFDKDQFLYMLISRFSPLPPSISTVVPALLGARRIPFLISAGLGFIPGVFVYAGLGAKLGELLGKVSDGEIITMSSVTNISTLWPIWALFALSFIPLVVRKLKG